MDTLAKLFTTSVRWNTAGALGYQALLLAHQTALYKVMSPATYGTMSIMLSFLYLGALIADCGLDTTLSTYFKTITQSQQFFKKMIIPHWLGIGLCAALLGLLLSVLYPYATGNHLNLMVLLAAFGIIIAESYRRSFRMVLQLSFNAKMVTIIDMSSMALYVGTVWTAYACNIPLTLELVMGSLAILLLGTCCAMGFVIHAWIANLPLNQTETLLPQQRFIRQRLLSGGNSLTHQLFSGNVLVPLVGMSAGPAQAGLTKLASYVAHGMVIITRKIVGSSGSALLSSLKNADWHYKRSAFSRLSNTLYTALFFSVVAMMSMNAHLVSRAIITYDQSLLLGAIILLIISEALCLSYETLFIIEEKTWYITLLNAATAIIALLSMWYGTSLPITAVLLSILTLRALLFIAMATLAYSFWNLPLPIPTYSRTLVTRTTLLAGLAYACGTPLAFLLMR